MNSNYSQSRDRVAITLLVLRLVVFGVLLMWALDKLVNTPQAAQIYAAYYSLGVPEPLVMLVGVLELLVLGAFLVGYRKRLTRAVLLAMMGIACVAPGRFYLTPFDDHILLYFARLPALAVVFLLYYMRDRDTLWTVDAGTRAGPAAEQGAGPGPRLALGLFLIRAAVFFDLLMWNMDKFFHPLQTSRIFAYFYNVGSIPGTSQLSYAAVYLMGAVQLLLILAFLVGYRKRLVYATVFVLHTVSTFAPWERFLQPFTSHTLLFLVSFPMLAGIGALYCLRDQDTLFVVGGSRTPAGAGFARFRDWSAASKAALAVIAAAGVYTLVATVQQARVQHEEGPALVAALQSRVEPSDELRALSPEWDTAEWTPTWHSANCTFDHPSVDDCWEIHFIVWVPGLPDENVMQGRRQVEAAWIVDRDGAPKFLPNGNAQDFFDAS